MDYRKIYEEKEGKYISLNQQKFKALIEEFVKQTNILSKENVEKYGQKFGYTFVYYRLRNLVLTEYPSFIPLFYQMLQQNGFHFQDEILQTMRTIGIESNPTIREDTKNFLLLSPYIQSIFSTKGKFTIHSDSLGEYSFYPAYYYFRTREKAIDILEDYIGRPYCHHAAYRLVSNLPHATLVTALIPYYFVGQYYHSIVQDQNGFYIDLTNGCVYDPKTGEKLFQKYIISNINKEELKTMRNQLKQEQKATDMPPALVLALHNQKGCEKNGKSFDC